MTRPFAGSRREAIIKALVGGAETSRDVSDVIGCDAARVSAELGAMSMDGRVERVRGNVPGKRGRFWVRWRARVTA